MIRSEWREAVGGADREALDQLLSEAAAFDEEAGFPATLPAHVDRASWHLLVWLVPDERLGQTPDDPPALAAHLALAVDASGEAEARYVVRPSSRSRGVTTMLLERRGLDLSGPDGWDGTGARSLRVWARGDHPAAQRLARRFRHLGISRSHREWQLLAPLRGGSDDLVDPQVVHVASGDGEADAAAKLWHDLGGRSDRPAGEPPLVALHGGQVVGAAWVDPAAAEPTEHGPAGRIEAVLLHPEAPSRLRHDLLLAALSVLRGADLKVGAITVDAEDEALVHDCRLLDFAHDRTDTEYRAP